MLSRYSTAVVKTVQTIIVMKIIKPRKIYHCQIKNILLLNKCKKAFVKVGLCFIFLSVALLTALIPDIVNHVEQKAVRFKTDLKYILFWKHPKKNKKNFFNRDMEYTPGQTEFIKQNCLHINCYITYNISLLRTEKDFDAIVFNIHDVKKLNVGYTNFVRNPNQIYIFKSHESADYHTFCNPLYDNFFNWTWSYKLNSDIPHPFINIHDTKNSIIGPKNLVDWIQGMEHTNKYKNKLVTKVKAVASLIANCKLKHKHQKFVKRFRDELKRYNHTLDTFGPCSEKKCPNGSIAQCFKLIEKEYYFNLVLEDSITEDYVTEKMVNAMTYMSLPIVTGSTNYTNFIPPGSYVNAHEFNIKKLVSIIDYLIKNPTKYSFFFDWKSYYYYTIRPRNYVCDLCKKLNEDKVMKSYKEFRRWWNSEFYDTCQGMKLYKMFRNTP